MFAAVQFLLLLVLLIPVTCFAYWLDGRRDRTG